MLHLKASESPAANQSQNPETASKTSENTKTADGAAQPVSIPGIGSPVALPPNYGGQTPNAPPPQASNSPIPGLQPMKGVNADTLFVEKIDDTDKRFDRVENAVVDLRKEVDNVMPSIIRLIAIESDINNLTRQLDVLLQKTPPQSNEPMDLTGGNKDAANLQVSQINPQPPPPPSVDTPQTSSATPSVKEPPSQNTGTAPSSAPPPAPPKQQAPPPAKTYSGSVATNLRFGEYDNKVRIVIDTNKPIKVTADFDPEEKILLLDMPGAKWVGPTQKTIGDSKLVSSYSITPSADGTGSTIVIPLKKDSHIMTKGTADPDSDNPNYRFYVDMAQ